jgi:prepilin-type N-terminal cleavage/methylation domain-containing protein
MYRSKKELKKASGFTIIEVMIVLAIAGLIMAIVFVAIPNLQRNTRNTNRSADASRILAAVGECLAARNGITTNCQQANIGTYITLGNNKEITTLGAASTTQAAIAYSTTCSADGATVNTGGTARQYTVSYLAETAGGTTTRCIGS